MTRWDRQETAVFVSENRAHVAANRVKLRFPNVQDVHVKPHIRRGQMQGWRLERQHTVSGHKTIITEFEVETYEL